MQLAVFNFRVDTQSIAGIAIRLVATSLMFMLCMTAISNAAAQIPTAGIENGALTAEQASLDVRVLKRALTTLHPALTKIPHSGRE